MKLPLGRSPWWGVGGATLGLIVSTGPIVQFSFGPFIKPLGAELGADRATLSVAILLAFSATAVLTPVAGRLVDRFGVRRVTLPAIVLSALATAALALSAPSISAFLPLYGLLGAIGAGQTPLAYAKSVAGSFDRRRGLALGLSMAGVGLGAAIVPAFAQTAITHLGWRAAYAALGAAVFLCGFPSVLLLLREPREEADRRNRPLDGMSGSQALRHREFWCLLFIFLVLVISTGGAIAHLVPILTDAGFPASTAAGAAGSAGLALVLGRVLVGYLLDKVFAPYVTLASILVTVLGLGLLSIPGSPQLTLFASVCLGLGLGAEVDLMAFLVSRYFGMGSFGVIYGYMFVAFNFGSGLGPFLMGVSHSRTGSYESALIAFGASLLVASALIFALGPYRFASLPQPAFGQPAEA